MHGHIGLCLIFLHGVLSSVTSNCPPLTMHNYCIVICISLTFLYCVFSNVSSNGLPDRCIVTLDAFVLGFLLCSFSNMSRRHIHTGCICLIFFHCVLSSVSSNCRPQRIQRRTGCICFDLSPLCVQKWVLKCDLPREYGITLVAFVWFFSAVCFQVPPQIACLIRCVISLVTFVSCPVIIKGIFAMTNIHHYLQFYAFFFAASIRLTRQGKIIPIDNFFRLIEELRWDFLNWKKLFQIWNQRWGFDILCLILQCN